MVPEIAAVIESIKVATTIAMGMVSLNTTTERNAAVIEIQAKLLEVQSAFFQLHEVNRELQERLAEMDAIDASLYRLEQVVSEIAEFRGRRAYRHTETEVFYCPNCFADRKLIPLQFSREGKSIKKCHKCGNIMGSSDESYTAVKL